MDQDHLVIDYSLKINFINKDVITESLNIILLEHKEAKRKNKVYSPEITKILNESLKISQSFNSEYIGLDHIFLAFLYIRKDIRTFLETLSINIDDLQTTLITTIQNGIEKEKAIPASKHKKQVKDISELLKSCCENINETIVRRGTFEIFGREKEIERSYEILLKKNKSNIILVGDAGVGKTAIVEGLAESIVKRTCPDLLLHKSILSLNLSGLLSGTMYRGQMEEKVKTIIDFLKQNEHFVLFIDEIHTIIGAGSSEGGLDISNMLKPYLSRGDISCIGATTKEEYEKFFKKDGALRRRFEKIEVKEPSIKDTLKIVKLAKRSYEDYHGVLYTNDSIKIIVDLCKKYLPEQKFPDKVFDILDESGARTRKEKISRPQECKDLEEELFKKSKDNQLDPSLEKKYKDILEKWGESIREKQFLVKRSIIYNIFAEKTGSSVEEIKNGTFVPKSNRIGF
jgi:ATP-dependent Clp protease ATP-binding subunit ClpC